MLRTFPLRAHVLALALGLVLLVGGLLTAIGQHLTRNLTDSLAGDLSLRINREVQASLLELMLPADMALRLFQHDGLADTTTLEQRLQRLPTIRAALEGSAALSSIYAGFDDGSFFFTRRLADDAERERFQAPRETAYLVQSIDLDDDVLRGQYLFFDAALRPLGRLERPHYHEEFDPRRRDWHRLAPRNGELLVTPPYPYFSDGQTGITLARRVADSEVVIGADIRLHTLGAVLARQRVTQGTRLALVDTGGELMAEDEDDARRTTLDNQGHPRLPSLQALSHPALGAAAELIAGAQAAPGRRMTRELSSGDQRWLLSAAALKPERPDSAFVVMAIPERELMAAAYQQRNAALTVTLLVLVIAVPLTWLLASQVVRPLQSLSHSAEAIRRFNFAEAGVPATRIREVAVLGATMDEMRQTIRRFMELNTAVAGDADFEHLLPRLLAETLSATYAQGGVLYLATDGQLTPAIALDTHGNALAEGALWDEAGKWSTAPAAGKLTKVAAALDVLTPTVSAALATRKVQTACVDAAQLTLLGLRGTGAASSPTQAVAVPLVNRQGELVGAMLLLLEAPADEDRLAFIGALSGLAAVSLEARSLIADQKALFEALLRMIASAIDAKSPHTGGHCARVPELVYLLARAACDADSGPYADFSLDDDDWETLRIAAWMHDCGKITTPEYVVDKATKLHTLYDRIHEIRMRFEVLKREAEIRCLQDLIDGAEVAPRLRVRDAELAALDDDFAFVARCNQGSESMPKADAARLHRIATRRWTRTLDDRLGLSEEEFARLSLSPAPPLPHAEPLLADRPEHHLPRRAEDGLDADNPWGFRMQAPALHLDLGELHNLSVRHGTLTEEERYLIRHHIIQTEIMLRQLPFPRQLAAVPEVAGSHHERMDGGGYPKKLTGAQMSPLARMMAIADIFEALTAGDRPYKPGKSLSDALTIMATMASNGHIDPDLFALFLRSGAYLSYAQRFIPPAQIGPVETASLLAQIEDGKRDREGEPTG